MIAPDISEKKELLASRIAMAGAIVVAGYLGMNPPGFAAQVVALAFGLAASSIFPALMMGIFNKKMNREGAIAGMLTGLLSTLIYIFWFKGWFFVPGTEMAANTPDNWFMGISPESFGAVGALLNFIVAIVVSKVTALHRSISSTWWKTSECPRAPQRLSITDSDCQETKQGQ